MVMGKYRHYHEDEGQHRRDWLLLEIATLLLWCMAVAIGIFIVGLGWVALG